MLKNESLLSVLTIGFDEKVVRKLIAWQEKEAFLYLGTLEHCLKGTSSAAFPVIDKAALAQKDIDFIILCEENKSLRYEAEQLKREKTAIITLDQFWIMETLAEQRLAMKKLYKEQQLFRTIVMYSHEGIQYVDENGIIQFVNPSFYRITNISPEERIGFHIKDVSPNGALARAYETKSPVIGHRSTGIGSNVETISNAAPIFVDGKFIGAVTTFQDVTEVRNLSRQLLEKEKEEKDTPVNHQGHEARFTFQHIIGESEQLKDAVSLAKRVAGTRSTIMISGESGTGKELFAHAIHAESPFCHHPFVAINCASIPSDLLESELFGYEKGAFTGAAGRKIGKIEFAKGGTLFLDEIGAMSLPMQAKLLRVLQFKEFERIGGLEKIKADFRIICATNENLHHLVMKKKFREDLYYRLHVIHLEIPPLRDRKEDIPLLVQYLMDKISADAGLSKMQLTNKGIALLYDYDWPGNVRELENFLERIMNVSPASVIPDSLVKEHLEQMQNKIPMKKAEQRHTLLSSPPTMPLRTIEKEYIKRALDHFGTTLEGKKKAARSLGISISTLYNKVKDYQLD